MYLEAHLFIITSHLLDCLFESVHLCPKALPLSGSHCNLYVD